MVNATMCSFPGCGNAALAVPYADRRLCGACMHRIRTQDQRAQDRRAREEQVREVVEEGRVQRRAKEDAKRARSRAASPARQEAARLRAVETLRTEPAPPKKTAHTPPRPLRERAPGWWEINDR